MSLDDLKYPQRQRLVFLDRCLTWRGRAKRRDLVDRFQISTAQAALDFREYLNRVAVAPIYDAAMKTYLAAPDHQPLSPSTLVEAFNVLDEAGDEPTMASIPQPIRQASPIIVSKLYAALKGRKAIWVAYTSINSGADEGQWLAPTHFTSDGENVHLRAFSYKHQAYRDYLPVRISPSSTFELRDLSSPLPVDEDWHTKAIFWLRPKSHLTDEQSDVVRQEYAFDGEFLTVEIRKAMEIYFRRRWRLDEPNSRLEIAKVEHIATDFSTET